MIEFHKQNDLSFMRKSNDPSGDVLTVRRGDDTMVVSKKNYIADPSIRSSIKFLGLTHSVLSSITSNFGEHIIQTDVVRSKIMPFIGKIGQFMVYKMDRVLGISHPYGEKCVHLSRGIVSGSYRLISFDSNSSMDFNCSLNERSEISYLYSSTDLRGFLIHEGRVIKKNVLQSFNHKFLPKDCSRGSGYTLEDMHNSSLFVSMKNELDSVFLSEKRFKDLCDLEKRGIFRMKDRLSARI